MGRRPDAALMKRKTTMRISIALVGLGCVFAWTSLSASASTTFPGRNGKIALESTGKNKCDQVAVVTPKRKIRVLVRGMGDCHNGPASLGDPDFSPNGTRLVFDSSDGAHNDVSVVNLKTGKVHRVVSGSAPSFLADGRIIYEAGHNAATAGTYIVRANRKGGHRLFKRQILAASPTGRWFVAQKGRNNLILLNRHGQQVRYLTHSPVFSGNPSFSPNGRWIVFDRGVANVPGFNVDLYIVRRDGTHLRRLTRSGRFLRPIFSPSGRWIVCNRFNDRSTTTGTKVVAFPVPHPSHQRVIVGLGSRHETTLTWALARPASRR